MRIATKYTCTVFSSQERLLYLPCRENGFSVFLKQFELLILELQAAITLLSVTRKITQLEYAEKLL